jgi:hypothetical protein
MENNKQKYLKYKTKYINLKNTIQKGGYNNVILLDEQINAISDELFDDFVSWILFSLRELMGYSDIRNLLINSFIKQSGIQGIYDKLIPFEPLRNDDTGVIKLCNDIITNNTHNIFIFTGTNLPDPDTMETHYNIFIVDKTENTVRAIDPAIKSINEQGEQELGIYHPFLALETIFPFFQNYGYNTGFIQLKNPAQTNPGDVFCQSWTLLILKLWLSSIRYGNINNPVEIPEDQLSKYALLLDFYKEIVLNFPTIAAIFNETYIKNINEQRKLIFINHPRKSIKTKGIYDNIKLATINATATLVNFIIPDDFEE